VFKRKKTLFKCKKFAGPKTLRQIFDQVVQISKCLRDRKFRMKLMKPKTRKRIRGKSSLLPQLAAMVEWLERKENFTLLTGKATSGMKCIQAGAKLTKKMGYSDLAQFVNFKCGAEWNSKYAESRFRAFVKKHKSTKRALLDPSSKKFCLG
jgi:hypothetical protein